MDIVEILGKIGFDWQVALANLVNFLIIFWLLKKFVFSKVAELMQARRQRIEKGVEDAREAEEKLSKANLEREEILKEARLDARDMIEKARKEEKMILAQAEEKAEEQTGEMIERAEREIEKRQQEVWRNLQDETKSLVIRGLERILSEDVDEKKAKKFQEELIDN